MRELKVYAEISGEPAFVGTIEGNDSRDARFTYDKEYAETPDARAVSISLPLQTESFDAVTTRNYFEGLLPEGFLKMTVAQSMRIDESDYLSILAALGRECLGALMVVDADDTSVSQMPAYEKLSLDQIRAIAAEGASKTVQLVTKAHLSLTGASGKVGLYYDPENMIWYLPEGTAPSTHIVKQSHVRLDSIVANEQLALMTAGALGIDVPESNIINLGYGDEDEVLFAVKRYDRVMDPQSGKCISGLKVPRRMHQEDFAQALGIAAINKYETGDEHYMKAMFDIVTQYSYNPIEDRMKLWDMIVFDYLIGNTDNHVKNKSLLYDDGLKKLRLAPDYDVISTVIYPESSRDMAFKVGGELSIDRISRDSFKAAAAECGIGEKLAMKHFDKLANGFEDALSEAAYILANKGIFSTLNLRDRILKERNYV